MSEKTAEIFKVSASAFKTYDQCPKKYYFSYIQHAPKKHWDHFDLGNFAHKVLEIFHSAYMKKEIPKQGLNKLMGESFEKARKEFANINDLIIAEAKELLIDYLESVKKNGMPIVKGCEAPFEFSLADNIVIRGFVDRVDVLKDGNFRIIDYKTTKSVKYLDPFQLSVYGLWLTKEYPKVETFKGAYLLLRFKGKLKEFDFNLEDVSAAKKDLIEFADKVKQEKIWPTIPSALCNYCDFKDICDAQTPW